MPNSLVRQHKGRPLLPMNDQFIKRSGGQFTGPVYDKLGDEILGGGGGTGDHGGLSGLADDDHTQYFNQTRGDARYALTGHNHSGVYDPAGTAAGAVSTHESTYNHANFATAYGWGNHASAGYVIGTPWTSEGYSTQTLSLGTTTQIPYMNAGGTDFLYSANFTFDGSSASLSGDLVINGATMSPLFQADASENKVWIGDDRTLSNQGVFNLSFTAPTAATGASGTAGKKGWNFNSQQGGSVSSAGTDFFGNGGAAGGGSFSTNAGGNVTGSYLFLTIAGKGGDLSFATGAGGVTSATSGYGSTSGAGGDMSFTLGNGGGVSVSNASANTGGIGGSSSFYAGNGGAATGSSSSNIGGAGGSLLFRGGYGGNTSGAGSVGGNGGNVTFQTGKAGSGTTSGQGGSVYFNYTTAGGSAVTILTLKDGYCWVNDSISFFFGTGKDASISYDGTNLNIYPKVVGSGILDVHGFIQTDGYNAADGTAGASATTGGLTFKNGLYTSGTATGGAVPSWLYYQVFS